LINPSNFKYYIHDGVGACRLQLLGQFGESEVAELNSCWQTARTTLGGRPLVLDVREVTSIDDSGKKWLAQMIQDGAALAHSEAVACPKPGWFSRLLSFRAGEVGAD
jgi:anti-anti-sigma regulatory factor